MAGPKGFKIADGYVEVHADYDRGELQRAAQAAADDHDAAFNKERLRNAKDSNTRDTNRRIGGLANADFVRGVQEQVRRQKESPFVSVQNIRRDASSLGRIHVAEFSKAADQAVAREPRLRRLGTRISRQIQTGLLGKDGAGSAAGAFVTRFVEAVTLGMADLKSSRIGGPMGTAFARIGTTAGIAFAGAFILHAGSAITALSPLLLAAIGGLGIFAQIKMWGVKKEDGKWVINMATRMGRAIKGLKDEFKDFLAFATDPLFEPIIKSIKIVTAYLNDLRGPVARFFGEFGKALPDLTKGVMKGIIEFFKALDPILKSGAFREGLREWGRQFPKIGKALGEFFAKVLANPDKVIDTIKRLGQDLVTLAHGAATLVTVLTDAMQIYDRFANWIDRFENSTGGKGGPLGGILNALKGFKPAFEQAFNSFRAWAEPKLAALGAWIQDKFWRALDWLKSLGAKLKALIGQGFASAVASLRQHLNEAVTAVKGFVDKVINWLKTLPPRGRAAIVLLPARLMAVFNTAAAQAAAKARDLVNRVINFLKTLPGKARSAVAALWSRMSSVFSSAVSNARARATSLVNGVINFLKTLPGKARSAVSRLWSSMSAAFSSAVSNARAKGKALVDGFINALKAIVARARAQVNAAKNAIKAAFAGAGSWLVSAGRSIMTGLANGIRNGASSAIAAAGAAASRILAAAKAKLGIHSPSTVFAEEVGKPIAEGIGVGMRKQIPVEFDGMRGLMPAMAGGGRGTAAAARSYSSTYSPNVNVHVSEGLNPVNAAARRALIKEIFLELEQYRKDYVR